MIAYIAVSYLGPHRPRYNGAAVYSLSTDYDQKKEIFLKTYSGDILINKG